MNGERHLPKYTVGVDVGRRSGGATVVVVLQRDPETGRLRTVESREIPKEGEKKRWRKTN